jgi:hypothetical protein
MMPEKFDRPVTTVWIRARDPLYIDTSYILEMTDHYKLVMEFVCFDLAQRVV